MTTALQTGRCLLLAASLWAAAARDSQDSPPVSGFSSNFGDASSLMQQQLGHRAQAAAPREDKPEPLGDHPDVVKRSFLDAPEHANAACPFPVKMQYGISCRCNRTGCGTYPDVTLLGPKQALIVTSAKGGLFMEPKVVATQSSSEHVKLNMAVETSKQHQEIFGFGGAVTDAVSYHYHNLVPEMQKVFVEQYWGFDGSRFSVARVPMNSADFSRMDYTMDNVTDDVDLEHFCLRDDSAAEVPCGTDYKANVLKAAKDAAEDAQDRTGNVNGTLRLFVSTWSPPLWYKNQNFDCHIKDGLYECWTLEGAEDRRAPSVSVVDPKACVGNSIMEPCQLNWFWGQGNSTITQRETSNNVAQTPVTEHITEKQEATKAALLQRAAADVGPSRSMRRLLRHRHPSILGTDPEAVPEIEELDLVLQEKPHFEPEHPSKAAKGNMFNRGFLSGNSTLQASWALYFSKFIDAYEELGLKVWGVTMQNEPTATMSMWQSTLINTAEQASFLRNHLGPTLRKNHPDVKIMVWDDSLTGLPEMEQLLSDNETSMYVDGVAYHWYTTIQGTYENSGNLHPSSFVSNVVSGGANVKDIYNKLQDINSENFVMMSEACNGYTLGTDWLGPRPGEWGFGYSYSHDIMWQTKNGASAWVDWNMMLGLDGGPNVAGNFVDSPVVFESNTSFIQNPSFFHLSHFSRYVPPGSRRLDISRTGCGLANQEYCEQSVAFLRPDGLVGVVLTNDAITVGPIMDLSGFAKMFVNIPHLAGGSGSSFPWRLSCGSHTVEGTIPHKSIQTIIMPCD